MNNHTDYNNEQRLDENPFKYILVRALTPRKQMSAIPAYRITIDHGSIWLGQECVASALPDAYCQEVRS